MKKSKQLKKKNSFWQKIPILKTVLKRWDFYRTIQESLHWHHNERDPKEIIKTVPPEGENIELHCTWVSEAFEPSNIDQLIKTLKKLGWDKPEKDIGNKESLTAWIRQGRNLGLGSSWINGGIILNRGDNSRFIASDIRRTKLPNMVDYGYLTIRNITSSLTLVTVLFVFNDEASSSLNGLFASSYSTRVKYQPSLLKSKGATYIGPVEQKRQAIRKELDNFHSTLYGWFSKNLPGHFSSLGATEFPTVDLITSRLYEQQSEDTQRLNEHYSDLLFEYGVEVWKCKTESTLELHLPWRRTEQPIATLFGNYDKLTENNEAYGGKDRAGLVNKLQLAFDRTMALWATHNLLLSDERNLSAIRDRASFKIKRTREAIKNLNFIKQHLLSISMDTQAVANDVSELSKVKSRYSHDTLDFEPPFYYKKNTVYPDLVELLRKQAEMRTEQLIKLESRVNKIIISSGNLTSAIANLRLAWWVAFLTLVVTIFTFLLFFK